MLQGLSFKCFRSTVASVFVEKVKSTSRSKSKCWRLGRIWSLRRPQLLKLNELRQTRMELNVARWTKIKSCHGDNDAKGLSGSQCLRARLASMVKGTNRILSSFLRNGSEITSLANNGCTQVPKIPTMKFLVVPKITSLANNGSYLFVLLKDNRR